MALQEIIRQDLKQAMKEKDEEKRNALRILIGEFGRFETKELTDADVIKIVKKLIKSEQEALSHAGGPTPSRYIEILESYLPQTASDDAIRSWIAENIDFSRYKNKMQAMREIMAHFGSSADGGQVKKILENM